MYTVHGTAGNINDVVKGNSLLHDEDVLAFGDAGYQGIEMRPETNAEVTWSIVIRPGQSKALNKEDVADALLDKSEKIKDDIRTKVDHTFRLIKRQFGLMKVHYSDLKKNSPTCHDVCSIEFVNGARQTEGAKQ